jgi:hypothetical protein
MARWGEWAKSWRLDGAAFSSSQQRSFYHYF